MIVLSFLRLLVFLFFLILIIRMIFDWVQVFARDWRPRGIVLIAAEAVYTTTDPPLRALRKVVPPLRIGGVALDLAFMLLFLIVVILMNVLPQ
ncbi:MAG: YggT family protein [Actinomycetota bacterium]|nr:YggT family protein [Actinomycetota bacterium]